MTVGSKCGSVGLNSIHTVIIRKAIMENVPTTSTQMLTNHYNSLIHASIAMKDNIGWAFYISYYIMSPHMQLLLSKLIATTPKVDINKHIYLAKGSMQGLSGCGFAAGD